MVVDTAPAKGFLPVPHDAKGFRPDRYNPAVNKVVLPPEQRFRYELVDLDPWRFKGSPRMEELMRLYQDRLQRENLAATEPPISHPST